MNKTFLLVIDIACIVVLLVIAFIYFTHPADQLPSWFPGHSATDTKVHMKHGLAAVIVALGAAAYGWFATGSKNDDGVKPSSGSSSTPQ